MRALAFAVSLVVASAAAAAPPALGVLKFQDETGALPFQGGAGRVMTNMLTNELAARGAFVVVERQKLRAVLEEQDLAESGRITPGQGAMIGKLIGADFLVTGTVTAFEEEVEEHYRGGMLSRGRIERESKGGYLAVDLRIIDTTTAQIALVRTVEGRTEGGTRTSAPNNYGLDDGPDARAVRAAVIEIVDYLECELVKRDACRTTFAEKERRRVETTRRAAKVD